MTRTQLLCGGGLILTAVLFMGAQLPPSSPAPAPPEPPAAPAVPTPPVPAAGAMKPTPAPEPIDPFSGFGGYEGGSSYLGIDTQDVTPQRMAPLKLKEERGVEVLTVDQDAPAGKAGLKEHDVILEFNGTKVEGVEHLRRMIHEIPPGRTATVAVSRDGKPMLFKVQLADKNQAMRMSSSHRVMVPRVPVVPDFDFPAVDVMVQTSGSRSGAVVENLTPQLGDYFGARNGEGVLVRSVEKGSAAEAAGLKAGDVIVRVESDRIGDRGDWKTALRNHRRGKVSVGIIRDKKEQTISITMPEPKDDSSFEVMPFGLDETEDMDAHTHVVAHLDREQIKQMRDAARQAQKQAKVEMKKQSEELKKHSEEMKKMQREIKTDWNFGSDSEL